MTKTTKALAALTAAIREEVKRELLAARDDRPLLNAQRRVRTLENRVRLLTKQRDKHRARGVELRGHIARYQRELVELREKCRNL